MRPDLSKITINDNLNRITQFLTDLIITPRTNLRNWSAITNQTPAAKIGYIGQHLASLITGVPGTGSGARGDDLADHSEVKSCNKVDQVDKCNNCGGRVLRFQDSCPRCGCTNISRKDDSKWLFSPRSEEEVQQYLDLERLVLILMDYPDFSSSNFSKIRVSSFEIYPRETRMSVFGQLLRNYYDNIYIPKHDDAQGKTNPMNLHPFSFQFYKCNPIKTFECIIYNIDTEPSITINHYIEPQIDRDNSITSIDMPSCLLCSTSNHNEWNMLIDNSDFDAEILPHLKQKMTKSQFIALPTKQKTEALPFLNEELKAKIPLRPITALRQRSIYRR